MMLFRLQGDWPTTSPHLTHNHLIFVVISCCSPPLRQTRRERERGKANLLWHCINNGVIHTYVLK